jgi:hypothetical protein
MRRLKCIWLMILIVVGIVRSYGQAGFYLYTGSSIGWTKDDIYSEKGAQFGYIIGFDVRTNNDPMYFLISGERGGIDLISNGKANFIGGGDLTYNKFKIGMGFDIKKLSRTSGLRTKLQGNFLSVSNYDEEGLSKIPTLKAKGYEEVNDGLIGLSTSISYFKKKFNIALEYEYPFFNIIKDKKETKLNFLNLNIGLRLF